jgi:hypothetical protein
MNIEQGAVEGVGRVESSILHKTVDNDGFPSAKNFTRTLSFPLKLHQMLDDAPVKNFDHIVSWHQPDGRSFKVHKSDLFAKYIMRSYFNQTKYTSFQRQLREPLQI